ncbi:MAG: hypothetical protein A2603_08935 [Bdellovibrionales bacterium RIFOXYD1_FULL_55_31]|nr:MAG: hypothetical protein A2603_08935 [Bdellovibrionales bacterium RIFOXYD1_FULL_55_31]
MRFAPTDFHRTARHEQTVAGSERPKHFLESRIENPDSKPCAQKRYLPELSIVSTFDSPG